METTNYGHLSRNLKESLERLTLCVPPYAGHAPTEASSMGWLIPEINRLERIVSALESIGVNLDEEDIEALEGIASDLTSGHREDMRESLNEWIGDWQQLAREREQQNAIDIMTSAGFVLNDEDGETWTRGNETVKLELTNGRESRYSWTYGFYHEDDDIDADYGVSGEFHRLLKLITPDNSDSACGGAPPSPLATTVRAETPKGAN